MSAASPTGNGQPETPMGDPGGALSRVGFEASPFLDAGACLELLGSLYPLSASMLFFRLEGFLREADAPCLAGEVSIPRRLLSSNLDPARAATSGHCNALEPIATDVVVECNASGQRCCFEFAPADRNPATGRQRECEGARLRIHFQEDSGLSKWVIVPLQLLVVSCGDASTGFQCFAHTIEFVDDDGEPLERWTYVGVSVGGWMSCMDDFERQVRTGTSRRFSAAWQKYVGAARVVLHSELVGVNQTEDAALDWEDREIAKLSGTGGGLNPAPGGLAGIARGVLSAPRVSIKERDDALAKWVTHPDALPPPPGLPHMVALAWHGDHFLRPDPVNHGDTLTPAEIVELRRQFRAGETAESIAANLGAKNLAVVQAAISAIGAQH